MAEQQIIEYVSNNRNRLFALIQELVRRPSENTPPTGNEGECQRFIASRLSAAGYDPDIYLLGEVAGLAEHPLFMPGRDYTARPNIAATRKGANGGRSLILSGHVDTVPHGTQPWTRDPFSGYIEAAGCTAGSNDMKAGVGISLFLMEALSEMNIRLAGDLTFETVIDEEFGGVNGTLAGRVRGYVADAAVITEPSFLRVCAAQRGGRIAHITFRATGGILTESAFPAGVIDQVRHFLNGVGALAEQRRRNCRPHGLYAHHCDPVPVSVTKIFTAPWGTREPITPPEECKVELYWQMMPGETQQEVEREFFAWLDGLVEAAPELFPTKPDVEFPIRWLPGSAIDPSEPLVQELAGAAEQVIQHRPAIVGIEGPCDMTYSTASGCRRHYGGPAAETHTRRTSM